MTYIQQVRKLKVPEQEDFLVNGMTTEQIKKQEPARKYFVSIGQLFEYALHFRHLLLTMVAKKEVRVQTESQTKFQRL